MYIGSLNETLFAAKYVQNNATYVTGIDDLLAASLATWAQFYRFPLPAIDFTLEYTAIEGSVVGYIECWRLDKCKIAIDPSYYQYDTVMDHEVGHALYFNLGGGNVEAQVLPGSPKSAGVFVDGHWQNLDNDVMAAMIGHDPKFSDVTILALSPGLSQTYLCGSDQSLCKMHEICYSVISNAPGLCTYMGKDVDYVTEHSHDSVYFYLIPVVSFFVICIILAVKWMGTPNGKTIETQLQE